ncbi:unnamed protein product [Adineta ricciae]|uniref:Ig-like domain-containing protein n=1 Tax=Adineta ricciae TaxID=249248 RepID=A0A815TLN3_ADIRI|nr:unnamed protein product [Adineta ricciae]
MMKTTLSITLVFSLNLIALHKTFAMPVNDWEEDLFTTDSIVFTDSTSTEEENVSNITIDANGTNMTDIDITTVSSIENITETNNSSEGITYEITTPISNQPESSDRIKFQVVINPATIEVQRGQTYELICSVYGADASTLIYWIQEEPERRYALTDTDDKYITGSQVLLRTRITLDDPSKIGKYTCMAQNVGGSSDSALLTMHEQTNFHYDYPRPESTPDVYRAAQDLRITAPEVVDGDYVEIQCENAASEDEGKIQWYFNNRLLHDEAPLYPRGKTLHIRPISRSYLGNYRCSIPESNYRDANSIIEFREQPSRHDVQPVFYPSTPLSIEEGANQLIQAPAGYYRAYWTRQDGQNLPSNIYQRGNDLQITNARSDHSGTYYCELYNVDGTRTTIPYEIRIQRSYTHHSFDNHLPKITIRPQSINLKESQRMIIQYTIISYEPTEIMWKKLTDQGYQPLSSAFTVEPNRLVLQHATPNDAGVYQITVRNSYGEAHEELRINVESQHYEHVTEPYYHQQQQQQVRVTVHPNEATVGVNEKAKLTCYVQGTQQYRVTWSRYAYDTSLPDYVRQQDNSVIITPTTNTPSEKLNLQCQVDLPGQVGSHRVYASVNVYGRGNKKK